MKIVYPKIGTEIKIGALPIPSTLRHGNIWGLKIEHQRDNHAPPPTSREAERCSYVDIFTGQVHTIWGDVVVKKINARLEILNDE